jgi:hypothetical protein
LSSPALRDASGEAVRSSGERLLQLLETLELTPWRFAGYWAGFPPDEPVRQKEQSERGRRFRAAKRSLSRWLRDEYAVDDEAAVEVVAVANRLLAERGLAGFPSDFLVTPSESRVAGMTELRSMLQEALERLARIEEKLG